MFSDYKYTTCSSACDDCCENPLDVNNFSEDYRLPYYEFAGGFNFFNKDDELISVYIDKVLYNEPVTVVFWSDGTKTVSKVHAEDKYNPEVGLILCILKKIHGSTGVRDLLRLWVPKNGEHWVTVHDVRKQEKS